MAENEILKQEDEIVKQESEQNGRTVKEMILYKMDRTLAIAGIIILGMAAMFVEHPVPASIQVSLVAIGGLVTYVGGKVGGGK